MIYKSANNKIIHGLYHMTQIKKNNPMKKSVITFAFTLVLACSFGQDTVKSSSTQPPEKKHRNELGLDMTPFIKYYLNFSDNFDYYQPGYMLTYRRYFKKSNIRSAIGGNYLYSEIPSPYNGDSLTNIFYNKQRSLVFRLGYEFFQDLSKRWQVYYGADLNATCSYQRNDAPYWNGGYANGYETTTAGYGIAPVLGIRFKMSNRISLITESSFLIQYYTSSSYRYYIPVTSAYPPKEDDPKSTNKRIGTTFSYPLSLVLTFVI